MLGLKCFPGILLINVICNELLHVSGTQKCLTWDLYRGEIIRFTCRVSNFVKPITLTDNHGKLFAQCTFYERQKSCQPSNSFVRVNYTTNEVVFYVNRASLWEYDGEWSCHIGREILISKVAISKGIINETNVRLESIMRKTNMIELTCSSCKTPVSYNAEFRINGRSEDNLSYDSRSGNCMHHKEPCQPDICGCSASGTEFFMLYTMNSSIHVSFSCDLMFLDPVTLAKFSKTATIEKDGTVYKPTKTITKIIKPGKSRSDTRESSRPGNKGTTVAIDQVNSTDENDKLGKDEKGHHLKWILIGLLLFIVIGFATFSFKKKCCKILGKLSQEKSKKQLHEDTFKALVVTPFLENEGNLSHRNSKKQPFKDTSKALVQIPLLENEDNLSYENSKAQSHEDTTKALVESPHLGDDGNVSYDNWKAQSHEDTTEALVESSLLWNGGNLSHENSTKQPLEDTSKALVDTLLLENEDNLLYENSKAQSNENTTKALEESPRLKNDGNLSYENSKAQSHEDTSKALVDSSLLAKNGNLSYVNLKKPSLEDTSKTLVESPLLENDGERQCMKDRQSTTANAENTCRDIEVYAGFDKRYKCEPCLNQGKKTDAYQYCVNCNEQYCRCCSVSHLSMKMTRTHTIIEISRLLCGLHDKREYTHICHPHGILLCNQCLESCHQNCNVNSINSFKSSYANIKSDDKELMRKSVSLTSSMENMNESFYAVTLDTADRQHTTYQGTDYFQKCTKAASMLRKAAIQQPKPRISFTTKDREQSFYQRKTGECYLLRTV